MSSTVNQPSTPIERVLRQARAMMGITRLPRALKRQLTTWTRGRLARGVPEEALGDLVAGTSEIECADGVLLAEATGDAKILEQTVPEVRAEVESGVLDGALEAIAHVESAGSDRVGVLRAIDARQKTRDLEQLLDGTLPDLEQALTTGAWDHRLEALLEVEAANKARVGARELLEARQSVEAALQVLEGSVADLVTFLNNADSPPIDALLQAEEQQKNRKTAIAALVRFRDTD